jgi:hypothetical protein
MEKRQKAKLRSDVAYFFFNFQVLFFNYYHFRFTAAKPEKRHEELYGVWFPCSEAVCLFLIFLLLEILD